MPACSSDSDNAAVQPNYIVQATVSVDEDGPVAFALVMDGDKNLVAFSEVIIGDERIVTSEISELKSGKNSEILIYTPQIPNEILSDEFFTVNTYFGVEDTINLITNQVYAREYQKGFFTGLVAGLGTEGSTIIIIVLLLIIIIGVILLLLKNKIFGKKNKNSASKFKFKPKRGKKF